MESAGFSKLMRRLLPETTALASKLSEPTPSVISESLETPLVSDGAIQPTPKGIVSHVIEEKTPSSSGDATEDKGGMSRRLNQASLNIVLCKYSITN
jgi:hypothetical protein